MALAIGWRNHSDEENTLGAAMIGEASAERILPRPDAPQRGWIEAFGAYFQRESHTLVIVLMSLNLRILPT